MFTTERLRLRAYQSSDDANILEIYNHTLTLSFVTKNFIVPHGEKFMPDTFMEIINTALMFCIIETVDEAKFVGFSLVGLESTKNRHGIFGIVLLPQFWNQGYGTEVTRFMVDHCFRCLGLHRISLTVFEGNDRAIAVYKNVGFVVEGNERKINWVSGAWRDVHHMGILEDEWFASKSGTNGSSSVE